MATDFLNDVRREIEGRTEDFYGELKAFYQGNAKAEQHLMEQTTQSFWQSLCLSGKRLQQRDLTVDMEMQEPVRRALLRRSPYHEKGRLLLHLPPDQSREDETYLLPQREKNRDPEDTGDHGSPLFESRCAGGYGNLPQLWS